MWDTQLTGWSSANGADSRWCRVVWAWDFPGDFPEGLELELGVEGKRGFFCGEGRGHGAGLSTKLVVQETGRRAATMGLFVESWAVLRRWTIHL